MGRLFGRLPSELLFLADPTVACAVDAAATLLLVQVEREERAAAEARRLESLLLGTTGRPAEVEWETIEEL
ncbi:MAG: hypothetical protein E6Q97_19975 [Desulfurellales bacterium]|nr:MAG: hypothetical protein E6Q97_19975 [Desulfurellales bacterium]